PGDGLVAVESADVRSEVVDAGHRHLHLNVGLVRESGQSGGDVAGPHGGPVALDAGRSGPGQDEGSLAGGGGGVALRDTAGPLEGVEVVVVGVGVSAGKQASGPVVGVVHFGLTEVQPVADDAHTDQRLFFGRGPVGSGGRLGPVD